MVPRAPGLLHGLAAVTPTSVALPGSDRCDVMHGTDPSLPPSLARGPGLGTPPKTDVVWVPTGGRYVTPWHLQPPLVCCFNSATRRHQQSSETRGNSSFPSNSKFAPSRLSPQACGEGPLCHAPAASELADPHRFEKQNQLAATEPLC